MLTNSGFIHKTLPTVLPVVTRSLGVETLVIVVIRSLQADRLIMWHRTRRRRLARM